MAGPSMLERFVISLLSKKNFREAKAEELMVDKTTGEILVKTPTGAGGIISYDYMSRTNSGVADFMNICKMQGLTTGTVHKIELKDQQLYPIEVTKNTNILPLFIKDATNKLVFKDMTTQERPLMEARLYVDASIIKDRLTDYFSGEPDVNFTIKYNGLTITKKVGVSEFNRMEFRKEFSHFIASQTNIPNKSAYDPAQFVELTDLKLELPTGVPTNSKIILHNIFTIK